jgi:uncharacterized protein with NRDE domain
MCLIVLAVDPDSRHRLVLAANRDERYARSTLAATEWEEHPGLIAGRDLHGGGSWLGVTRGGRFAALTNFHEPIEPRADAPSRGGLVTGFLAGDAAPGEYLRRLQPGAEAYNGFNLLVGDADGVFWYSNRGGVEPVRLDSGVYGLSNHHLDTPWPKVVAARERMRELLERGEAVEAAGLLDLLHDRTMADPLPGEAPLSERERAFTAAFIVTPDFGTRSTTALALRSGGGGFLAERTYLRGSPAFDEVRFFL